MMHRAEDHVFSVKAFYQTSSVTVHKVLKEIHIATGTSMICWYKSFELTGSVCNKKGVVGRHSQCHLGQPT
jgi:hypothetical protein